ncbi:hypothetical protein Bbelb_212680 [Branchiostoma belcheri]|nr:hypothetical protein Bbelb_212680 [Branchiostoma belcheri]
MLVGFRSVYLGEALQVSWWPQRPDRTQKSTWLTCPPRRFVMIRLFCAIRFWREMCQATCEVNAYRILGKTGCTRSSGFLKPTAYGGIVADKNTVVASIRLRKRLAKE